MPEFNAFYVQPSGATEKRLISAIDDREAVVRAKAAAPDVETLEIWCGHRLVARIVEPVAA